VSEEELKPGDRPYDSILGLLISTLGVIVLVAGVVTASYALGVMGFIDLIVGLILIAQSDFRR
jgi:membrane-bound ClpP family serine protease